MYDQGARSMNMKESERKEIRYKGMTWEKSELEKNPNRQTLQYCGASARNVILFIMHLYKAKESIMCREGKRRVSMLVHLSTLENHWAISHHAMWSLLLKRLCSSV